MYLFGFSSSERVATLHKSYFGALSADGLVIGGSMLAMWVAAGAVTRNSIAPLLSGPASACALQNCAGLNGYCLGSVVCRLPAYHVPWTLITLAALCLGLGIVLRQLVVGATESLMEQYPSTYKTALFALGVAGMYGICFDFLVNWMMAPFRPLLARTQLNVAIAGWGAMLLLFSIWRYLVIWPVKSIDQKAHILLNEGQKLSSSSGWGNT